ncbi:acyltransferase family protein [Caulobacter segnis]
MPRLRWLRRASLRCDFAVIGISGLALVAIAVTRGTMMGGWLLNLGHILIGTLRVTFSFSVGAVLYRLSPKINAPRIPVIALLALSALPFLISSPAPASSAEYEVACVFLLFPLLITFGQNCETGPRMAVICEWLGSISYAVYVIHMPLLPIARAIAPRTGPLWDIAFLLGCCVLAWMLDAAFDRPVRRWLGQRMRPRPATAAPV